MRQRVSPTADFSERPPDRIVVMIGESVVLGMASGEDDIEVTIKCNIAREISSARLFGVSVFF